MSETLSAYENTLLQVDVKSDGVIDGRNENRIKEFARNYTKEQRNTLTDVEFQGLVNRIDILLKQHDIELAGLGEKLEWAKQAVRKWTQEKMSVFQKTQNIGGALWDGWEKWVNGAITGTVDLFEWTGTWIGETTAEAIHGEEWGLTNKLVQDTEWIRTGLEITGKILWETLGKLSNGEENEVIDTTTTYWKEQVKGILNMTPEECARFTWEGLAFVATAVIGVKGLDKVSKMNTISSEITMGNQGVTKIIDKVILKWKEIHTKVTNGNGNNELNLGDYRAFSGQRGAVGERRKLSPSNENIKLVSKTEIVDPLALTQILEKTPKEYGELMNFELAKLRDPKQNFEHIFRGVKQNETPNVIKAVNENANQWIKDMFGNINNLVKYLEQYPDRGRLRGWIDGWWKFDRRIISEIKTTMMEVKTLRREKGLQIDWDNTDTLRDILYRINNIPNP